MDLLEQLAIYGNLPMQQRYLGVSLLDQSDKLSNHARAICSTACESLVLICKISAGSGVTGKLGVAGVVASTAADAQLVLKTS